MKNQSYIWDLAASNRGQLNKSWLGIKDNLQCQGKCLKQAVFKILILIRCVTLMPVIWSCTSC